MSDEWIWDASVKGFGARRQRDGVFYYLRYRLGGVQRMKSIGRHGSPWTADTARRQATVALGKVVTGLDPFAEDRKRERLRHSVPRQCAT